MIRFLALCVALLLLYLGFGTIAQYDSPLHFSSLNYQIETTLFVFMIIFLLAGFTLILSFKIISLIFNIPSALKQKWHKQKLIKNNKALFDALTSLLMGDKEKSLSLVNGVMPNLCKESQNIAHLILAKAEDSFDKKISCLSELANQKEYSFYALKKLAKLLYENKQYNQAKDYALSAFNKSNEDAELVLTLIRIYASLKLWTKLPFIVSKLEQADKNLFVESSSEIAGFYCLAAKYQLEIQCDQDALEYLESALELKPDCTDAIVLFTELSTTMKNTQATLKVLKSAFLANPSFDIAKMYVANCKDSPEKIYKTFSSIADPKQYAGLFLALSSYLGLPKKISEIIDAK